MKTRILVSKLRGIGDAVLTTPALELLREWRPEAAITFLVPGVVAPLFNGDPHLDAVRPCDNASSLLTVAWMRWQRFDLYLDLNATGKVSRLARYSGASRVLRHRHNRSTKERYQYSPNAIEWDVHAVADACERPMPASVPSPRIYLTEAERQAAEAFWHGHDVKGDEVVVLGTSATRPAKRWPAGHYASLVRRLEGNCRFAILVGPEPVEAAFADEVSRAIGRSHTPLIVDRVPGIRALASVLSTARAFVGNDNGPKHIAAAVGTPTLTLFGPENADEWHPYDHTAQRLLYLRDLACRRTGDGLWCSVHECHEHGHRCLVDLTPDAAVEQTRLMLRTAKVALCQAARG